MTSARPANAAAKLTNLLGRLQTHHPETYRHSQRVADLTLLLARQAQASDWPAETLRAAALLHDIGKLEIPPALLNKVRSLTCDERLRFQRHTLDGAALLSPVPGLALAQSVARNHHERWDGSGYPNGLRGPAIPLAARIVCLADVYDALRASRAYKSERTHREVLATMTQTHRQFDPHLLHLFLAAETMIHQFYDGASC